MIASPAAIRGLAGMLRNRADEVRAEGDRLTARAVALGWRGRTGDAMRVAVGDAATALRKSADRHDDAAAALDRHADAVEATLRLAATVTGGIKDAVETAVGWL